MRGLYVIFDRGQHKIGMATSTNCESEENPGREENRVIGPFEVDCMLHLSINV